jgi:hypothetical protein
MVLATGTTSINMVNIAVASGESVQLSEAMTGANTGTYTTTLTCDAGSLNAATGQLTVPAVHPPEITCTFYQCAGAAPSAASSPSAPSATSAYRPGRSDHRHHRSSDRLIP